MENNKIRQFIMDIMREIDGEFEINDKTQLLEEELLDSVSILYLVTELENAYGIEIPLEDVVESNFKDLASIERYISTRLKD